MAEIRTSLRKGQKIKLLVMSILCLAAAIYGGWQYWLRLPERTAVFDEYREAVETRTLLYEKAETGQALTSQENEAFLAADAFVNEHADDKPQRPSKYDRILNLWLWFIGGLSGIPFLIWPMWKYRNGGWILYDEGTLRTPKGERIPDEKICDIDMSSWRGLINPQAGNKSTWQAKLILVENRKVVMDDYLWDGLAEIIIHYAHRFHPDTWTEAGDPIQEGIEKASQALGSDDDSSSSSAGTAPEEGSQTRPDA